MYYVKQQIESFTSSNIPSLYPDWDDTTTYIFEASDPTSASIARVGAWYYRSLTNDNTGFNPVEYENTKWVKWQVANSHALLDQRAQTVSTLTAGSISVTFAIGFRWDTIGIGFFDGENVTIELLDATDTVVWTYTTQGAYSSNVTDWYSWTFEPRVFEFGRSVAIKLERYLGATKCRVTINQAVIDSDTTCGFLVGGESIYMGQTMLPLNFSYTSYTQRIKDTFGNTNIIRRPIEDGIGFQTCINKQNLLSRQRIIKKDLDNLAMFVLDDTKDESEIVVYGLMSNPTLLYDQFDESVISWQIEELN